MDNRLYDYRHKLDIALVNKTQVLFAPILGARIISEAAEIYDWPLTAEEIGDRAFLYFQQMAKCALPSYEPYKSYWLMPKKVRSYKQFVKAAFLISLELDKDVFKLIRWYPAQDRGFAPSGYDDIILTSVSAKELGEFVLRQFNHIEIS